MIRATKVEQTIVTFTLPERAGVSGSGREREVTTAISGATSILYALAECLGYDVLPKRAES